jgi:acetolactate synthase-1/2/3 large subunit
LAEDVLTGAESLVLAAAQSGVRVCFANPGTTEMPLVAALDRVPGIRAVLGLHENVCTGAADGYARITGHAAMTLLHLGPGLANGLANLHNARRANTPLVNVVGDHTSWHLPFDAPLTSDIAALAATVGTVHHVTDRAGVAATTAGAIAEAHQRRGVSTLIVPADHQQATAPRSQADLAPRARRPVVAVDHLKEVAQRLRDARRPLFLLGGNALTRIGQRAAGMIAAATGAALYCETFPARVDRGGGLPAIDRLPYFPETAAAVLSEADVVVVAGAEEPVAYFGYEGVPSVLTAPGTLVKLAHPIEDAEQALVELADLIGATTPIAATAPETAPPDDSETLTGRIIGRVVAACLPDDAIVSIEGGTSGYPFYTESASAVTHTVMTNTGGAIGQGLPCALGAAIAAPHRPVIALQSDGSGLYTAQALWSMSRERANVIVLIAANHTYNVLRTELGRHGNAEFGSQAEALTSLADPCVDWVALAAGFGVPAVRAVTVADLRKALTDAAATGGPHLIEMAL